MPLQFLFLRHGETDWNRELRLIGRSDPVLNDRGIAQAETAADSLSGLGVSRILSSPLARARQTAEIVANRVEASVDFAPDLMERNFGPLEGRLLGELEDVYGNGYSIATRDDLPPGAESWDDLCTRVGKVIRENASERSKGLTLFVSHFAVLSAVCATLSVPAFSAQNAVPYRFSCHDGKWSVQGP